MKGDFSRSTFDPQKHYHLVRMQQGRVQLDADWNEQADLFARRVESEAADLVGGCGGPLRCDSDPFRVDPNTAPTDAFFLTAGHYYVDGILCENDEAVAFAQIPGRPEQEVQPDLPGLTFQNGIQLEAILEQSKPLWGFDPALNTKGAFIAYLDVWQRHITALEDPGIREVALGGPDTATREKTVWQVKLLSVGDGTNCLSRPDTWQRLTKEKTCRLKARAEAEKEEGLCVVPATAGYRGLENQLYRVEIHRGGEAGQATFKWSRDNGFVVTRWLAKKDEDLALSVESSGRDAVLGFRAGDWVELTDDTRELWGLPGTLVKIDRVEGNSLIMEDDEPQTNRNLRFSDYPRNPRVRRWNQGDATPTVTAADKPGSDLDVDGGAVPVREGVWIKLEDGVQIWFEKLKNGKASYRTGDYWCIPARTAGSDAQSGAIEWPKDGDDPCPVAPHGIQHHYCRLAVVKFDPAPPLGKTKWELVQDCRRLFPPVTKLTSLLYVGGDGQEALPNSKLLEPLQVRVANGQIPVVGARVQFQVVPGAGSGNLGGQGTVTVETVGPDGIAQCEWTLGTAESQQVEARLLDAADGDVPGQIVVFNATTEHDRLLYVSGDGQEALPNHDLLADLQVRVLNKHVPVVGAKVQFALVPGAGSGNLGGQGTVTVATAGPNGIASSKWTLGPEDKQLVEARLFDGSNPVPGQVVIFHASTSLAKNVAYDPGNCPGIQATTVQEAIDALCQMDRGSGCEATVGKGGKYQTIGQALDKLLGRQGVICLCLLPGEPHDLADLRVLEKPDPRTHLKISGCVSGVRAFAKSPIVVQGLASFTLRDLDISLLASADPAALSLLHCANVTVESCRITGRTKSGGLVAVAGAQRIRASGNIAQAVVDEALKRAVGLAKDFGLPAFLITLFEQPDVWPFEARVIEAAAQLAGMDDASRISMARTLSIALVTAVAGASVRPAEMETYQRLVDTLAAKQPHFLDLAAALTDVRVTALRSSPGVALVLGDADGLVDLENNDLQGILSLYGLARFQLFDPADLTKLAPFLKDNVRIRPSRGVLHLRNNRIAAVLCSGEAVRGVKDAIGAGKGEIRGVFSSFFFTNTLVDSFNSQILSHHLSMTSNRFAGVPAAGGGLATNAVARDVLVAIADQAEYVGNSGRDTTLRNVTRISDKAANVELTIVP